ncbi:hypothetical protein MMPV_006819 [Pyropia vietnamensis]
MGGGGIGSASAHPTGGVDRYTALLEPHALRLYGRWRAVVRRTLALGWGHCCGYPVLTIHSSLLPPPDTCPAAAGAAVAAAVAPVAPSTPLVVVLVTHGGGRPSAAAGRTLAATLEAAHLEGPRIRALYVLGADVAWRAAAAAASWVVGGAIRSAWTSIVYVDLVEDLEAALGAGIGEAMGLTWGEVVADEEHREWLGRQWARSPVTLDPSAPLMQLESVAFTDSASSATAARPLIKSVGDFV